MTDDIKIIDGAVPRDLVDTLDQLVRMPIWKHGGKSNNEDPFGFWLATFADSESALEKFSPELYALWRCVKPHVPADQTIEQVYANGQTYGQSGQIHKDIDLPNHKTVIYYCNSHWQPAWHGETLFYTPDRSEILRAVLPRPGRLVVFDGNLPHSGRDPSRLCPVMRVTITFKLKPAGAVSGASAGAPQPS